MAWNKKAGKGISKAKAKEMIERYQSKHKDNTRSVYFDNEVLQALISTPKGAGVRFTFATNDEGQNTLVLDAVNDEGKVITDLAGLTDVNALSQPSTGGPVDVGSPCPPVCP